jgi:catechol 2,3-dioxygenase-like lactoylglutathione lyase family enzyme
MKFNMIAVSIGVIIPLSWSPQQKDSVTPKIETPTTLTHQSNTKNMKLGAFSISLSVKDLSASKLFYENLGFSVLGGNLKMNYLIMKNESALIGLFQGMFEDNIITFNPGWDENGNNVEPFNDVREIQQHLKDKGIALESEVDTNTSGPASFIVKDPDGNVIYFDQHR